MKQGQTREYAIDIQKLTKTYGKARGVTELTLQVEKGDIFGFLGPNGAGKSTTIRSILGLINFQSGSARILGMDVKENHKEILKKIGYMPSEAMFYPSMKVDDVLKFAADMHKKECSEERRMLCERLEVPVDKKSMNCLWETARKSVSSVPCSISRSCLSLMSLPADWIR